MVELFDDADEQAAFYLQEEYVNWRDAIPGARDFLRDVQVKKIEKKAQTSTLGNTRVRTIPGVNSQDDLQEVQYSIKTFNPFDNVNIKTQEKKMKKLYIEKDTIVREEDE